MMASGRLPARETAAAHIETMAGWDASAVELADTAEDGGHAPFWAIEIARDGSVDPMYLCDDGYVR
ncbi:MAG: hypothetical protein F4Y02_16950 [Chloroflexi bacterium]|nr:hypothetical protein [Chloroflexota bacterium]